MSTTIPGDEPLVQHPGEWCPDCQESCGAQTLLTSMVRYYRCTRCDRPWQFTR